MEELSVSLEEREAITDDEENESSSDMDDFTPSDTEESEVENPVGKDHFSGLDQEERNDVDLSMQGRKRETKKEHELEGKTDIINCSSKGLGGTVSKESNPDGVENISYRSNSFVACSLGNSVNNLVFDDEVEKQVGPCGFIINSQKRLSSNEHIGVSEGLTKVNGPNSSLGPTPPFPDGQFNCIGPSFPYSPILSSAGSNQINPLGGTTNNKQNGGNVAEEDTENRVEKLPSSFDSHCKKIKNSKKARNKMRALFDLGENVDNFIYLVEFSVAATNMIKSGSNFLYSNNYLNLEVPLSSSSLTHSGIRNCNNRFENGGFSNMEVGLWNHMNRLGITKVSDAYDPISRIQELEKRDIKEVQERKGKDNSYP